jgi:AAA+ superfamily predicted ATPase
MAARRRFSSAAPLLKNRLLELFDHSAHHPSPLLSKHLKVDERVVDYLLDGNHLDPRLLPYARLIVPKDRLQDLFLPAEVKGRLARLAGAEHLTGQRPIIYLRGRYGAGKQALAEALCHELGMELLVIDGLKLLDADEGSFATLSHLAGREALLQSAALYWEGFEAILAEDRRHQRELLMRQWASRQGVVFLAGDMADEGLEVLRGVNCLRFDLPRPTHAERVQLWQRSLNGDRTHGNELDLQDLANKFRFNSGEIRDTVAAARNLACWRDPGDGVTMSDLYTSCRLQSNGRLTPLTTKMTLRHTWKDIVLPADRLRQLQEICSYVKYRTRVYDEWGFEHKLLLGTGLNIMFSGPSGTGKTLAAGIVANELKLDIAKIDLSLVVSKYIGETEKNLGRIFHAAESANVILFFDEADALFGKRSEVKDAHDRYANIEIGYLLQKLEEHEGIVIMASNLSKNIDEAFQRRMQFIVEFPVPDEEMREAIWRTIFPSEAPLDPIDFEPIARRFKLSGGNIRNISLHAAFLAAADSGRISLKHLMEAIRWEYVKMGSFLPHDFEALGNPEEIP